MRYAILACVLLAGCGQFAEQSDYKPLAASTITLVTLKKEVAPEPSPTGKCEDCNGTGKVGDGTVMVTCQKCGGDGVMGAALCTSCGCETPCENCACEAKQVPVDQPEPPVVQQVPAVQYPRAVTQAPVRYQQDCSNGQCRPARFGIFRWRR